MSPWAVLLFFLWCVGIMVVLDRIYSQLTIIKDNTLEARLSLHMISERLNFFEQSGRYIGADPLKPTVTLTTTGPYDNRWKEDRDAE
jgi:hypothetical protein